jgi:hypothetical protein
MRLEWCLGEWPLLSGATDDESRLIHIRQHELAGVGQKGNVVAIRVSKPTAKAPALRHTPK